MGDQAHRPSRLILVKHGSPQIEPGQPRSQWSLSDQGRADAASLARKLASFAPDRLVCSPEPKASETASIIGGVLGLAPQLDIDLREQEADHNPFVSQAEFERQVAEMFARPDELMLGEETGLAARLRFGRTLERLQEASAPVIVAHGRVITLWLSDQLGIEPMAFWERLGLGTAAIVSMPGGSIEFVDP